MEGSSGSSGIVSPDMNRFQDSSWESEVNRRIVEKGKEAVELAVEPLDKLLGKYGYTDLDEMLRDSKELPQEEIAKVRKLAGDENSRVYFLKSKEEENPENGKYLAYFPLGEGLACIMVIDNNDLKNPIDFNIAGNRMMREKLVKLEDVIYFNTKSGQAPNAVSMRGLIPSKDNLFLCEGINFFEVHTCFDNDSSKIIIPPFGCEKMRAQLLLSKNPWISLAFPIVDMPGFPRWLRDVTHPDLVLHRMYSSLVVLHEIGHLYQEMYKNKEASNLSRIASERGAWDYALAIHNSLRKKSIDIALGLSDASAETLAQLALLSYEIVNLTYSDSVPLKEQDYFSERVANVLPPDLNDKIIYAVKIFTVWIESYIRNPDLIQNWLHQIKKLRENYPHVPSLEDILSGK